MRKVILPLILLLAVTTSAYAYTVFPDFKGKSFTLSTDNDSYTIDTTVLTHRYDGVKVEQYADRIWNITEDDKSSLVILTDNRKDIDTAIFTLTYLKADTTAIIAPYTALDEKDISAISPHFLFQAEYQEDFSGFLAGQDVAAVQLSAGDVIEIDGDSAWTWTTAAGQRIIYITCPECGERIKLRLPLK